MNAQQIVLAHLEAHGSASVAEVAAATKSLTQRGVRRAFENLAYRGRIRKTVRLPRAPGQKGAQCHRWEIQHEEPSVAAVRQAIQAQPSLATVWAQPVKEAA